ncbi:cytochrome P450 [Aspergillus brunneoviolaceus CBS 621.78]|uniref:Cytochrome P450 n=1 Tax=Aspergillus brunneoviolaceus CBS 621.78 TaxID=1450534 RepID=A0ACD1FTK1_9EURO|nr:cytochrome P450 [Aspergillus brunneoviolaceus CBS 621.78]RAH40245.1 cytochrome P450 [Aspergillus brunneoviolaceus CBS 621.78]
MVPSATIENLGILLILYYGGWILYARWLHPLAIFPGPPLASVSRLWVVLHVARGKAVIEQKELHRKYGPIVRIAPNELIMNEARSLKAIYGANSGWHIRSHDADALLARYPDHFSATDEQLHARRRRIVSHAYSMSNVLQAEKYVDKCTDVLLERFAELARQGATVDFFRWARMYAYDAVGEFYFGRMFGFLQNGHDHLGYIAATDVLIPVMAIAGVMPSYIRPIFMSVGLMFGRIRKAFGALGHLTKAADMVVEDRMSEAKKAEGRSGHSDILTRIFDIYYDKGKSLDFEVTDVKMEAWAAFFGGSDTTAITMAATMFHIVKDRRIYQTLLEEIDTATAKGELGASHIAYNEAVKLPFLSACLKEGMRVHPTTALTLPRQTASEERMVSGYKIPGGTRIGANAPIVQSDPSVFGEDADEFCPERWMRPGADRLGQYILHFGAGSRTCLGKHMAMCELYKVIPQILRSFHLELDSPSEPCLATQEYWFNKPTAVQLKVQRREIGRPD